jgi:hypothetical protein
MRRVSLVLLLMALASASAEAQQVQVQRRSPALIKYGKWGLLAASVVMNLMAREAHQKADDAFAVVQDACSLDRTRCTTLPDGAYADTELEQQYQRSLDYDDSARKWLVGGETALVGAAVGFIWELTRSRTRRTNIPFEPEVSERAGRTQLGFRYSF